MPRIPLTWVEKAVRTWLNRPALLRAAFPVVIMGTLWWSSSREPAPVSAGQLRAFLHNAMHVVAYAALSGAFLCWLEPCPQPGSIRRRPALAAVLLSAGYGVVDELHQSWVPGRVCSVVDLASDVLGALLAVLLFDAVLSNSRPAVNALPWCLAGCLASVTLATWGPW